MTHEDDIHDDKRMRQPVYIVVDRSSAVTSKSIVSVRHRIKNLIRSMRNDAFASETVRVAIITYGSKAEVALPLT
ncbi:VWA domain-containing protein, partial [Dolichospermum sp. ST_sed3]|nr:VWA domain-containing protein [Dolichospermum sp. ST_sed3]